MKRYPLRTWLGRYQKWVLELYGRRSYRIVSATLEKFFDGFPRNSDLRQFTVADVAERIGTIHTLKVNNLTGVSPQSNPRKVIRPSVLHRSRYLSVASKFWDWMIVDCGLPLFNPVKPYLSTTEHKAPPKEDKVLRLEEFKKLFAAAEPLLKQYLIDVILDRKSKAIPPYWVRRVFKRATDIAGLPHVNMTLVRKAVGQGLWRDIIKDYATIIESELSEFKTRNAELYKPQFTRDLWGDIQSPAIDIWPTVPNDYYRDPMVNWVT